MQNPKSCWSACSESEIETCNLVSPGLGKTESEEEQLLQNNLSDDF